MPGSTSAIEKSAIVINSIIIQRQCPIAPCSMPDSSKHMTLVAVMHLVLYRCLQETQTLCLSL